MAKGELSYKRTLKTEKHFPVKSIANLGQIEWRLIITGLRNPKLMNVERKYSQIDFNTKTSSA